MALPNSPESWALLKRDMERIDIVKPLPDSMAVMHYLYNNQPIPHLKHWAHKKARHALNYSTGPFHFNLKETTKMNIQEKDCRRCEELDEEGQCNRSSGYKFRPDNFRVACAGSFTPVQNRDCRNCQRFNGVRERCIEREGQDLGHRAHTTIGGCPNIEPLLTPKPSPTVLTYNFGDGEDPVRIIKGDKTLSLENVWSYKPCGDEYRKMSMAFTEIGFNPSTEIPFTQPRLDLLSDPAFAWLLNSEFFLKAEEEKPAYGIGQWFAGRSSTRYLLCRSVNPSGVKLIHTGSIEDRDVAPSECTPGFWETIKGANDAIGHTCWEHLQPIDSPLKG